MAQGVVSCPILGQAGRGRERYVSALSSDLFGKPGVYRRPRVRGHCHGAFSLTRISEEKSVIIMAKNHPVREIPSQHLILTALTAREVEVLLRVATGSRNHEIAADLQVSIKTVEFHLSNILSKLHCRSRTEAVVRAWQSKMIELTDYPDSGP